LLLDITEGKKRFRVRCRYEGPWHIRPAQTTGPLRGLISRPFRESSPEPRKLFGRGEKRRREGFPIPSISSRFPFLRQGDREGKKTRFPFSAAAADSSAVPDSDDREKKIAAGSSAVLPRRAPSPGVSLATRYALLEPSISSPGLCDALLPLVPPRSYNGRASGVRAFDRSRRMGRDAVGQFAVNCSILHRG
jgi:hypothetical protein